MAINTQNGTELSGRRILVREDREDRDVKQYGGEGEEAPARAPRAPMPPRAPGAGRGEGGVGRGAGGRGRGRGRGPPPERTGESSGLQVQICLINRNIKCLISLAVVMLFCLSNCAQVVVQGIPWSYTWKELKDMFADIGSIERADVAIGSDGRSRVRSCDYPVSNSPSAFIHSNTFFLHPLRDSEPLSSAMRRLPRQLSPTGMDRTSRDAAWPSFWTSLHKDSWARELGQPGWSWRVGLGAWSWMG